MVLVLATYATFRHVIYCDFITFDDDFYVYENVHVQDGLTLSGLRWAFTTGHAANWHPVTWLTHMLDCDLYGLQPGGHHFTNLVIHIINALLLFLWLRSMTGSLWKSAFIAAFFALHPLRVESVVWVSERKDVLSCLFWMLTLIAYVGYARKPTILRYMLLSLSLAVGLMAKPMLITIPCVLLLLDYWPLKRLSLRAFIEKIPLLVLAISSAVITVIVQKRGGAVEALDISPIPDRLGNAVIAYGKYIIQTFWPKDLAVFYPRQVGIVPMGQLIIGLVLLACISELVRRYRKEAPYLVTGWLWYLGTLVPVIGLVQVGGQSHADRYTYIPVIGLTIGIVWGIEKLVEHRRRCRHIVNAFLFIALIALSINTQIYVRHWENGITLFKHALSVTPPNAKSHTNLGRALHDKGDFDEAIKHYNSAISIKPLDYRPYYNLGLICFERDEFEKSEEYFKSALQLKPDHVKSHYNFGCLMLKQNKLMEAIASFSKALELDPDYIKAEVNLGIALASAGRDDLAMGHFSRALTLDPDNVDAHINLAVLLLKREDKNEAIRHLEVVLRINPYDKDAKQYLELARPEK